MTEQQQQILNLLRERLAEEESGAAETYIRFYFSGRVDAARDCIKAVEAFFQEQNNGK